MAGFLPAKEKSSLGHEAKRETEQARKWLLAERYPR
jgi:hypothetical protein